MKSLTCSCLSASLLALALTVSPSTHAEPRKAGDIADANAAALQGAQDAALVGALHEFAYEVGGLYAIDTSPQRITDIGLEPGETLLSVSAGDTTRWIVGDARSGTGAGGQAHVLVKPNASGLSTNLVIMTDRRVYHVELKSSSKPGMAAVSWRYPAELTLAATQTAEAEAALDVETLNFGYQIKGDKPDWRPLRAFDDGRQVFIEMPAHIETVDAPPLFVVSEEGAELVNYRIRDRYYVVDRLFERAEMRLGDRRRKTVTILRTRPPVGQGDQGGGHG